VKGVRYAALEYMYFQNVYDSREYIDLFKTEILCVQYKQFSVNWHERCINTTVFYDSYYCGV
jgi:hypothetical protein